jgi:omega-amidase
MQDLKIALVQSIQHWEDIPANLEMFDQKVKFLNGKADIIVLPEMFSTGFSMNPEKLAETMEGPAVAWMMQAAKSADAVISGSLIIKENGNYYNRLVWMKPDGSMEYYDKRHLFSMAGEEKIYTPGTKKLIVDVKGWKVCPMVCYDLRFPVWIRNAEQYDVLIFSANWPDRRIQHWRKLLQARAIENQCFVIGVNRVGKDGNDFEYRGHSMFIDTQGDIEIEIKDEEKTEIAVLKYDTLKFTRRYMPFLDDMDGFSVNR